VNPQILPATARRATHGKTPYDECFLDSGLPRAHYERVFAELDGRSLASLAEAVQRRADAAGICYEGGRFRVDPIPRLMDAAEWAFVEAALGQRLRALNAFLADAYTEGRAVAAGVIPGRVLDEAIHFEPLARELPRVPYARVAGPDLVRDPDGAFWSLEDNLRTPSGLAFLIPMREILASSYASADAARPPDGLTAALATVLRSADPFGAGDPSVLLVHDGPQAPARHEHRQLARRLGIPLVALDRLYVKQGRLRAWLEHRSREVDVLYLRTSEERLTVPGGALTALGELLIEPMRRGTLVCVNPFGAGLADDKAVHSYSADLIRFFLDEEPLLPIVPAYDLGEPDQFAEALDRLGELVVKGRGGSGGHEVVIVEELDGDELRGLEARLRADPSGFVAQKHVALSTHPTVAGGQLAPRHVDLRSFVFADGNSVAALAGGFTRFAPKAGEMVVNTAQGGGGKDTWVLREAHRRR
jgi:carboxylate-amine ligase